jgi:hypothetical protein
VKLDQPEEESMKKYGWSGLIAAGACAWAVGIAAQTTSPPTSSQTRSSSQSAANQVTVTGCIQRATATPGATGTTGSTSTSSSSSGSNYILTNATPAGSGSSSSSATSPSTAGTSGSGAMHATYRLDADDSKLSAHVGHKVEITGTLESASSSSSSSSPSTSPSTSSSSSASSMSGPQLKVESVRMIASSCSE